MGKVKDIARITISKDVEITDARFLAILRVLLHYKACLVYEVAD